MSISVEDGTGSPLAEAYCSVEYATEYHAKRLNTAWDTASNAQREAALISATAYLDGRYTWKGMPISALQALGWPRSGVFVEAAGYASGSSRELVQNHEISGIPEQLKRATAEAALRALSGPLVRDLARGGKIVSKKEAVEGAVSVETTYAAGAPTQTTYPVIDGVLKGLCESSSGVGIRRG